MSGRKQTYVSIADRELRRLREQAGRLRTLQTDLPERLAEIRSSTMAELRAQNARMDQRWSQFRERTNQLQSELKDLERDSQRRLQEGLKTARKEYTGLVKQERAERLKHQAQMRKEYTSLINQERSERLQQIGELQSRVGHLEDREDRLHKMAASWLQDLRILQDGVDQLPHERFAPGGMQRIAGLIAQAGANLSNGASQTALTQAQNAYFQLIELRADVLFREQEFEAAYCVALEQVRSLIEEVKQNRQGVITDEEGKEQDIQVDIDFWSKGMLTQFLDRLQSIETTLREQRSTLSIEEVRQKEEEANALRPQLVDAVEQARLAIINSQACYNVAEIIAEVMEGQGYRVEKGTYEGEDQRGAYAIKMRNLGGDEFVSIITPSEQQELAYNTEMNFFDRNRDETMRQTFARSLREP